MSSENPTSREDASRQRDGEVGDVGELPETPLSPLQRVICNTAFRSLTLRERRQSVLEKIEATQLTAKPAPSTTTASTDSEPKC